LSRKKIVFVEKIIFGISPYFSVCPGNGGLQACSEKKEFTIEFFDLRLTIEFKRLWIDD